MKTTIKYPNGDRYECEVDEQGLPHGVGVMKYEKRQYENWAESQVSCKKYSGQWSHGVKSGQGKMEYYRNGHGVTEYFGDWDNDLPNGKGKLTNHSRVTDMIYQGKWLNDMRDGHGVWMYENGDVVECEFVEGKSHVEMECK